MEEIKKEFEDLITIKTFLKGAINEKGGTITDDTPFSEYPNQVRTKTGNVFDTLNITENGEHDVKNYKKANVVVQSDLLEDIKLILGVWDKYDEECIIKVPYGVNELAPYTLYKNNTINIGSDKDPYAVHLPKTINKLGFASIGTGRIFYDGNLEDWIKIKKGYPYNTVWYSWFSTTNVSSAINFNNNGYYYGDFVTPSNISELVDGAFSHVYTNYPQENATLTITKNIKKIGHGAFQTLRGFKKIVFEEGIEINFTNENSIFNWCYATEIELPIMNKIPNACFSNSLFEKIEIKSGATTIEDEAFSTCKAKIINLPNTINEIKYRAFMSCNNLSSIKIPSSVTNISGKEVFRAGAYNVEMESSTPCTINSSTFSYFSGKIYVPKGSRETYISATNWSYQASKIYEKYVVVMNIPNELLNNETITYSVDGGKTYQQFTNSVLSLNEVATIKIKSTDSSQTILIGTTSGGNDVGTISNSELTFSFTTDTQVYLTIQ